MDLSSLAGLGSLANGGGSQRKLKKPAAQLYQSQDPNDLEYIHGLAQAQGSLLTPDDIRANHSEGGPANTALMEASGRSYDRRRHDQIFADALAAQDPYAVHDAIDSSPIRSPAWGAYFGRTQAKADEAGLLGMKFNDADPFAGMAENDEIGRRYMDTGRTWEPVTKYNRRPAANGLRSIAQGE